MITEEVLRRIRPETSRADAQVAAHVLGAAAGEYGITTRLRVATWLANIAVESGFRNVRELMYYTNAARAAGIFWTAFGGVASRAQPFMRRPEALANRVYAGRLGNGPEASGDGWRYRGGGYIQLTGRTLYGTYSPSGVDLAAHPELIERPEVSARAAALYWTQRGCNGPADRGDIDGTRRMVNGPAMLHKEEVRTYYARALAALPEVVVPPAPPARPAPAAGLVPLLAPDGTPLPGFGRARVMVRTDGQGMKVIAVPDGKEV